MTAVPRTSRPCPNRTIFQASHYHSNPQSVIFTFWSLRAPGSTDKAFFSIQLFFTKLISTATSLAKDSRQEESNPEPLGPLVRLSGWLTTWPPPRTLKVERIRSNEVRKKRSEQKSWSVVNPNQLQVEFPTRYFSIFAAKLCLDINC